MSKNRLKAVKPPEELDALERQLAYAIYENPAMSKQDMERKFGIGQSKLDRRLKSKAFKEFQISLETSLWERIAMARSMAMTNAISYLKNPQTDAAVDTMKLLLKNAAEHPSTLPAPEVSEPEFKDPDSQL